jgi:hypothetical protein
MWLAQMAQANKAAALSTAPNSGAKQTIKPGQQTQINRPGLPKPQEKTTPTEARRSRTQQTRPGKNRAFNCQQKSGANPKTAGDHRSAWTNRNPKPPPQKA